MFSKHKRIKDRKTIQAVRKKYCEACGNRTTIEPHHMYSVGSGGGDIRENLIQLCSVCHIAAHSGAIDRESLKKIVAEREGIDADKLHRINRQAMGYEV